MQSGRRHDGRRGFRIRELFPTPGTLLTLQRPANLWRGVTLTLVAIPYFMLCALSYELIHAGLPKPLWIVYIVAGFCGLLFLGNGLVCALRLVPYYLIQRPRARRRAAEQDALAAEATEPPIEQIQAPSQPDAAEDLASDTPRCEQCGRATIAEPFATDHEVGTAYMCPEHGVHSVAAEGSHT